MAGTPAAVVRRVHRIGTTLEATGLQAGTLYQYRLAAENENTGETEKQESHGPEGSFTTAPGACPAGFDGRSRRDRRDLSDDLGHRQPGRPARHVHVRTRRLRRHGDAVWGCLLGTAGAGTTPVQETLALSGLQPGVTYAYRIRVASGYGESTGAMATFATAGLPSVLVVPTVLPQLPIPNIAFPGVEVATRHPTGHPAKCKRGYARNRHGKCVKAKKKAGRHGKGARRKGR